MAEALPAVILTYDDNQNPTVVIGDVAYPSWPAVVAAVEGLDVPENAVAVARMLTHFSYRSRYRVIEDPAAYEATIRGRIAVEPAEAPFEQNVIRARAFGVPDFSTIHAPKTDQGVLRFCVNDTALNVPYQVQAVPRDPDLAKQNYTLFPLSPVGP